MGAESVTPWGAIANSAAGLLQFGIGTIQANRNQKKLEKLINSYQPSGSIMDYYGKALNRYSTNPYTSSLYNNAMRGASRGFTSGVNTLNDRKSVLGGIGSLVQGYNDSSLKAAAAAEGQQGQALSQLGAATGMKAAEDKIPFNLKYSLLAQKASGGNQLMNAGVSNILGGAGSLSQMAMLKQIYGDDYGDSTNTATIGGGGINQADVINRAIQRRR